VEGETCGCGMRVKGRLTPTVPFIRYLNIICLGFLQPTVCSELIAVQMPAAVRRHRMAASCLRRRISLPRLRRPKLDPNRGSKREDWRMSLWARISWC